MPRLDRGIRYSRNSEIPYDRRGVVLDSPDQVGRRHLNMRRKRPNVANSYWRQA
jgi:hypothetical protein